MLGVGPDVPVAVFTNRMPAGVVAALSILKAGAGYVFRSDPLDPAERLECVLRDVRTPFVVAERGIAGRLPKGKWKVIPLDETPLLFSEPTDRLAAPAPNHLAYIGYNSGSTGRPLGVEVTHAALLNLILWHRRAFQVTSSDNASQIAAPSLDTAICEILASTLPPAPVCTFRALTPAGPPCRCENGWWTNTSLWPSLPRLWLNS